MTPFIKAAIVDYKLGNLWSVKLACEYVGMKADITFEKKDILAADLVILPGVGAFGDAMQTLNKLDLITVLKDVAEAGTPLLGICLGMQLLMSESYEFGRHEGLGLVEGQVVRFEISTRTGERMKIPHMGWDSIYGTVWTDTPLCGIPQQTCMYFGHSFYTEPEDPKVVCCSSKYGDVEFASGIKKGNIFAVQFHPERSGTHGIAIYRNFNADLLKIKNAACD